MTHTPGPWRYTNKNTVCEQQTDDVIAAPGRNFAAITPSQTLEANARLIAASVSLYDYVAMRASLGDNDAKALLQEVGLAESVTNEAGTN